MISNFFYKLGRILNSVPLVIYRFKHWFFQWKVDEEGDIAFVVMNRMAFLKYKEHTLIKFRGVKGWAPAPKWVGEI